MKTQCVCKTGPTGNGPRCTRNAKQGHDLCGIHLKKCHLKVDNNNPAPLTAAQLLRRSPAAAAAAVPGQRRRSSSPVFSSALGGPPLLTLNEHGKNRREMYGEMQRHFINIGSCLEPNLRDSHIVLPVNINKRSNDRDIIFEKRIGTDSLYGEVYKVYTKNSRRAPPKYFASKVMPVNPDNTNEIIIMKKVSEFAYFDGFINFPLIYTHLRCDKKCSTSRCPKIVHRVDNYYTIYTELANCGDLQSFLKTTRTSKILESIILQIFYTVYTFHLRTGCVHGDMHLGNILIHEILPGGHFHYTIAINDKIITVPNHGFIAILNDFGRATEIGNDMTDVVKDYLNPLNCLILINRGGYDSDGLVRLPTNIVNWINANLDYIKHGSGITYDDFITNFPFVALKETTDF